MKLVRVVGCLRCIPMTRIGVVAGRRGAHVLHMREGPADTHRIANRAIIGHVLDALREAGADEVAVSA
jgi:hypothetical protein